MCVVCVGGGDQRINVCVCVCVWGGGGWGVEGGTKELSVKYVKQLMHVYKVYQGMCVAPSKKSWQEYISSCMI